MSRELAWVKACFLAQELFARAAPAGAAAPAPLNRTNYDWIRRIWIMGQLKDLRSARSKHLKAAGWRERWSTAILFGAALAAGLSLLVFRETMNQGQPANDLLLFAIGLLPGVAAVLVGCSEKLAFRAMARQCDRMMELFARAIAMLPPTFEEADPGPVRNVLRELGAEAMRETAGWVSIYRERPFSLLQK
jgi:F0F1-type ATP synthase membrane subunit c/vacuolar-type H+-ATPase subunit K